MIGNDIVDLADDESRPGSLHPRFDERVFAGAERETLYASRDVHRLRWLLWAAKESAFKLLRRTLPDLVFSPVRFVVRGTGPRAATVEASGHVVHVGYECGPEFVHCVASYHAAGPTITDVGLLPSARGGAGKGAGKEPGRLTPWADAGEVARGLAVVSIARRLSIDPRELTVERDGRMPIVLHRGRPLSGTLSLSHHGRFVAFAWR